MIDEYDDWQWFIAPGQVWGIPKPRNLNGTIPRGDRVWRYVYITAIWSGIGRGHQHQLMCRTKGVYNSTGNVWAVSILLERGATYYCTPPKGAA
jgi:hypothetical protein